MEFGAQKAEHQTHMFKDVQPSSDAASNDTERHAVSEPLCILRMSAVVRRVGLSRSSIYSYQRAGIFPRAVKIGPHAVGYVVQEINEWISKARSDREGVSA